MTTPHPYADPFHTGLMQLTPSQRLMNADVFRRRSGPAMLPSGGGGAMPLGGLADSIGEVLHSAGHGQNQPVVSDADAPRQGVVSDGQDLYHGRDNGDGTSTVTHMGTDTFAAQQEGY